MEKVEASESRKIYGECRPCWTNSLENCRGDAESQGWTPTLTAKIKMAKKKQKPKNRKSKATFNFVKLTKKQVESNRSKAYDYVM